MFVHTMTASVLFAIGFYAGSLICKICKRIKMRLGACRNGGWDAERDAPAKPAGKEEE